MHRLGRGVTDFVRKLHENTIKAKATVLARKIQVLRRAGSAVVCPVRKFVGDG